jgi:hypothetical protein
MDGELAYLLARCRLILDVIEHAEPRPLVMDLRRIVEETANAGNIRGLRTIRRDLLEMSQVLPAEARVALQAALKVQEADDPVHRGG